MNYGWGIVLRGKPAFCLCADGDTNGGVEEEKGTTSGNLPSEPACIQLCHIDCTIPIIFSMVYIKPDTR